ncbi:MAG: glycosyltransferase family 2 protein [Bacteroidetes bacterium]|nr:glycosyltransferase family 2 protein [Bacteroidota bacterium]
MDISTNRLVHADAAHAASGSIAFVVPVFNEEESVERLVHEIEEYRVAHPSVEEVIIVDDGSKDATFRLLQSLVRELRGYRLLRFSRNFGHQLAVTAGLSAVRSDAAVVLDADLQDPLTVVDALIEQWRAGHDVVYGIRRSRAGESSLTSRLRHGYYVFFQRFTGLDAPPDVGDFRLISRPVIDAFRQFREQQPYVRGLIAWLGFSQIGVEYDREGRASGTSKYPYRKLVQLAGHGITSFTNKPLKYAVRLGLFTSLLSILGLVWAVFAKLLQPELVSGWASLIFVAFFFGGLQLFFLGVVGSYLGRVYDEVKARPRYVIAETWSSAGSLLGKQESEQQGRMGV